MQISVRYNHKIQEFMNTLGSLDFMIDNKRPADFNNSFSLNNFLKKIK